MKKNGLIISSIKYKVFNDGKQIMNNNRNNCLNFKNLNQEKEKERRREKEKKSKLKEKANESRAKIEI